MQILKQQRPYRIVVKNNKNNLQDFDAIPKFPAGAFAEIF